MDLSFECDAHHSRSRRVEGTQEGYDHAQITCRAAAQVAGEVFTVISQLPTAEYFRRFEWTTPHIFPTVKT